MEDFGNGKMERVLGIYTKLLNGQTVNKAKEAEKYQVNERSRGISMISEISWSWTPRIQVISIPSLTTEEAKATGWRRSIR